MFYNGASCDIYIGKGAGKKLLSDIQNARKSVKIVSPYLSPFLIAELINIRQRNLNIELITTDNIEDFYGSYEKNIYKLINQNKITNKIAIAIRKKWINISKTIEYVGFGLLPILTVAIYYFNNIKIVFGLIPVSIMFLIAQIYKKKIRNKQIYSYWYSQLFPFKVYMSPYKTAQSDTFIHSKIYLIDDEIAYLGSLNFTSSGTKHNYETRIRTKDPYAIKEIKEEIYQLMNHSHLPEKDIQYWGKQLYKEPIN